MNNSSDEEEVIQEDVTEKEEIEENEEYIVTMNIPECFYRGFTQEDLDEEGKKLGYISQILNKDGFVTIELYESDYNSIIDELTTSFDEQINDLLNDEDLHYADLSYLDDYTYFKVVLEDSMYLEEDRPFGDILFMIGTMYDAYTTNSIDTYSIEYYDKEDNLLSTDVFSGTFDSFYESHLELFEEEVDSMSTSSSL